VRVVLGIDESKMNRVAPLVSTGTAVMVTFLVCGIWCRRSGFVAQPDSTKKNARRDTAEPGTYRKRVWRMFIAGLRFCSV
jgi:hypothetical protein